MPRRGDPPQPPSPLAELALLRRARDRIDREFASPLSVESLARHAMMSRAHFSRRYRATYGETPYQHVLTRRIERAATLLRQTDLSVAEVCTEVGATSAASFGVAFRRAIGCPPGEYRARHADGRGPGRGLPACAIRGAGRPRGRPPGGGTG